MVSKCDKNGPWDVGFKHCEDNILKGKVWERESNYMVISLKRVISSSFSFLSILILIYAYNTLQSYRL